MTESRPSVPLSTGINRAREEEEDDEEMERDFINSVVHLIGTLLDPKAKIKSEISSNEKNDVGGGELELLISRGQPWATSRLPAHCGPRDSRNSHSWIRVRIGRRSF